MKAVVFREPKKVSVESVPDPSIEDPRDVILRVTRTAICGSDLHIYNGAVPQPKPLILGHEFMGVVEDVGSEVTWLSRGDRVLVPSSIACGRCWFCSHGLQAHCENSNPSNYGPEGGLWSNKGGGIFGYTDLYGGYPGGQAEYVRVPFADVGPRKVPEQLGDEQVILLTNALPTALAGVDWAEVGRGDSVAVIGCGPVGLLAQRLAWLRGAARVIGIDLVPYRLEAARRFANADVIDARSEDAVERVRDLTQGRGADVCIEAVGLDADRSQLQKLATAVHQERGSTSALQTAFSAVRRGGRVSVLGSYTTPFESFPLGQLLDKGVRVRGGQAPVHNVVDELLRHILNHQVSAQEIITHHLPLADAARGYQVFNQKEDGCIKVVLAP